MKQNTDAISTEDRSNCNCCGEVKVVRMYVLQNGWTAWVCKECRKGDETGNREVAY